MSLIPRLGLTEIPPGVTLTPLPARRRTGVVRRAGTGRHPAIAAFSAAVRESADQYLRESRPIG